MALSAAQMAQMRRLLDEALELSTGSQFSPSVGIQISPPRSRFGLFRPDEAGLQLLGDGPQKTRANPRAAASLLTPAVRE